MRNIFTFDRSVPYTRPAKRPAHHNTRAPKPEEFRAEEFERETMPDWDDLERLADEFDRVDADFDCCRKTDKAGRIANNPAVKNALASLEDTNGAIGLALARLHDLATELTAIEGLLTTVYERAESETTTATAEEIAFMSEGGLYSHEVVNELRRAIWHFHKAIDRPALDRAITAVQLAEIRSDFRE